MVFLLKIIILIKRLLTAFFIIIFRPLKALLRLLFYKVVVKFYSIYLSFVNRIGWKRVGENIFSILLNQKFVHVVILFLTVLISFTNLIDKTKAGDIYSNSNHVILVDIVENEFGDIDSLEYSEEYLDENIGTTTVRSKYIDSSVAIKNQPRINTNQAGVSENDRLLLNKEGTAIIKSDISSTSKTKQPRTTIVFHEVRPGDTVSTIAQEYEISVNTILWENNLSAYSLIKPGDKLSILPVTGVTHKISKGESMKSIALKYEIEENKIIEINKISDSSKLAIGNVLIIPDGKKINTAEYKPKRYSAVAAISSLIKPSGASPAASNKMNWPTQGHRITQYYSWRHTGLDVANKVGTPLYAADAGVVEFQGWSNGYGNNVVINHGGGKKTRYAHLSKFYSKKGEKIEKGETIGAMGSTGWSTGSHLHFEVIINGAKVNPLNYIR